MSNNNNQRPKPPPKLIIPNEEKLESGDQVKSTSGITTDDERTARELAFLRQSLNSARTQLTEIRTIIDNPFHQVGYLVNEAPIRNILDRDESTTQE